MAEDIKDLIEKIQQEGVKAAEDKAKEIEGQAKQQAEELIKEAKAAAKKITADAQNQADKMQESAKISLQQAGRDLMLGLKKEISDMLGELIIYAAREALKPQELVKIIASLVKNYNEKDKENIRIELNKADFEKLEEGLFSELGREAKKGITLKGEDDILAGFTISFDAGKSRFDFTDRALADYIGARLKPKLKEILE
jgi:V/A-type H+-transporting ATPase subunit E